MFKKVYTYPPPDNATLKNKFGIRDFETAKNLERDLSALRLTSVGYITGDFDTKHIKSIHKHLFQDMYDWAGEFRKVNIYKQNVSFCDVTKLDNWFTSLSKQLNANAVMQKGISVEKAADFMGMYYRAYNFGHPFREGNGRIGRVLLVQMAQQAGYNLSFKNVTKQEWEEASIDARYGNYDNLKDIFERSLSLRQPPVKAYDLSNEVLTFDKQEDNTDDYSL